MKQVNGFTLFPSPNISYPIHQGKNFYYPDSEIRAIIDLKMNVFSKLREVKKIIHELKKDVKDFFSDEDIEILKKISSESESNNDLTRFIAKIINENLVRYQDAPSKKIDIICGKFENDQRFFQERYNAFSKWFNLSEKECGKEKVETIINDQIYMAFPNQFGDRYDTQLYLHEEALLSIAEDNVSNLEKVKALHLIAIDHIAAITSFSLHSPDSSHSEHMWERYSDKGKGVALTYSVDDLVKLWAKRFLENSSKIFFRPVKYDENHNPCKLFTEFAQAYYKSSVTPAVYNKFYNEFIFIKKYQYQHEKELRFVDFLIERKSALQSLRSNNYEKISKEWGEAIASIRQNCEFIAPIKITLGWDCDLQAENIKKLIKYAEHKKIEIEILDKNIDYNNKSYYKSRMDLEII